MLFETNKSTAKPVRPQGRSGAPGLRQTNCDTVIPTPGGTGTGTGRLYGASNLVCLVVLRYLFLSSENLYDPAPSTPLCGQASAEAIYRVHILLSPRCGRFGPWAQPLRRAESAEVYCL